MRMTMFLLLATLLLASCAQKPREHVVLLPDENGHVGEVRISSRSGEVRLQEAGQTADITAAGATETRTMGQEEIQQRFGAALQAMPKPVLRFYLYFETGGTQLTEESQALLPKLLQAVKERIPCEVGIIGHTDTKGDESANLLLGHKRALMVRDMLVELGLPAERISIESHGEKNLLVPTADGVDEPRNRRVETVVR